MQGEGWELGPAHCSLKRSVDAPFRQRGTLPSKYLVPDFASRISSPVEKGKGWLLGSLVAQPFVEERVRQRAPGRPKHRGVWGALLEVPRLSAHPVSTEEQSWNSGRSVSRHSRM